ncbi:MAG TPA: hypothetical protein VFG23_12360, partial [Polyangia bacterium]|nr:hypothetical protein [Polyangia bacterium]
MDNTSGSLTAILIGVYATLALDVFGTLTSSPQTTELFAKDRKDSLMYWVGIGAGTAVAFGLIATVKSGRAGPVLVTTAVATGMVLLYVHASHRGMDGGGGGEEA